MKIQINMNDEQLGREIKDLIDGRLKSIVRAEVIDVVGKEIQKKLDGFNFSTLKGYIEKEAKKSSEAIRARRSIWEFRFQK